jgi:hypothetical protein
MLRAEPDPVMVPIRGATAAEQHGGSKARQLAASLQAHGDGVITVMIVQCSRPAPEFQLQPRPD